MLAEAVLENRFGVALENRVATFDVQSDAMAPIIKKGSKMAVERFYYSVNPIERWHVILVLLSHTETDLIPRTVFHTDKSGKKQELARPHFPYIKRVVGLPGESVRLTGKEILINNQSLAIPDDLAMSYSAFPQLKNLRYAAAEDYKVPRDSVFVLSDNLKTGIDSRMIGAVPMRCVMGRMMV